MFEYMTYTNVMAARNALEYYEQILNAPDDHADQRRRGHRQTQAGWSKERRRRDVLLPLLVCWAQHRHIAIDPSGNLDDGHRHRILPTAQEPQINGHFS